MIILHANWSVDGVRLWGESAEGFRQHRMAARDSSSVATLAATHPYVVPAADLIRALQTLGLPGDDMDAGAHSIRIPRDDHGPIPSDRLAAASGVIEAPVGEDDDDEVIDLAEALEAEAAPDSGSARVASDRDNDSDHAGGGETDTDDNSDVEIPEPDPIEIPSVLISTAAAMEALLRLGTLEGAAERSGIAFGHTTHYWSGVARFAAELLVDQRFIPSLLQHADMTLAGTWRPWVHDEATRERALMLINGMPPVECALDDDGSRDAWPRLDRALAGMINEAVRAVLVDEDFADALDGREPLNDPHVAWLGGLLADESAVRPGRDAAPELFSAVSEWLRGLGQTGGAGGLRLVLMLDEPMTEGLDDTKDPVGAEAEWTLTIALGRAGTDGPTHVIEAERLWTDTGAVDQAVAAGVIHPEEFLLAELGRAARLYPPLESLLTDAHPSELRLDTAGAYRFLSEFRDLLDESGVVIETPTWWGERSERLSARLQIDAEPLDDRADGGASPSGGPVMLGLGTLVQYRWQVAVGDRTMTAEEFDALAREAAKGAGLLRLDGHWIEVRPEDIAEARALMNDERGGEMTLLEAIQLAHGAAGAAVGLPVRGLDASGWVADLLEASQRDEPMLQVKQPRDFLGELRPYQLTGLSWLLFLDRFGLGACLADDMGLGKTIQLIALLLAERQDRPSPGPTLLVVPTSVIENWVREIRKFGPSIRVKVQHGPERPLGDDFEEAIKDVDVIITTYTIISRDRETLLATDWHRVVLDEAQYIKNPPTKQTTTIRALQTRRRIALTGTPVENRLSELWSIMEFCNPGYLGPAGEFRRRFGLPIERRRDREASGRLRRLVQPFILRRLKTDPTVIDDLPDCVTTKEYAYLTREQATLYEAAVDRMLGRVQEAEGIQRRGLVLATLVRLKQICNHPAQLESESDNGALPASPAIFSKRSGKCKRIIEMLEETVAAGDKALVFTQFRRMGHLLTAMIRHELDSPVVFLHGGTPTNKRQQMIDRFQDPAGGIPIFVLSLRAGGVGLNLTAANHVFHFDRWWNPAVENQATDRAFRIGQTRTVHVHKFVCMGTLEERVDQMIEQKTELARKIIGAGEDWLADMSTGQLRDLLSLRGATVEGESS